jgi:poly(hydroxyalkanoate) depolymerase family esterase
MSEDFVAAMRRAIAAARTADRVDVKATIERALGAAGLTGAPHGLPKGRPGGPSAGVPRMRLPLGDAVRTLRAGRSALPGAGMRGPAEPAVPEGAAFRSEVHAGPHGSRRYRLYVPQTAERRGLVLMLHGCTQTPEDFAVGTGMNRVAEAEGLVVVYPEQTRAENSMACWNWFRPGDQNRGAGEPALLAGLAQGVARAEGVPKDRVFVAGLSAGGAMAAVLAGTYGDVFAAAGVHSGIAHRGAGDVLSAFAAMRGDGGAAPARDDGAPGAVGAVQGDGQGRVHWRAPRGDVRLIVFQGSADATVHPSNAGQVAAAAGFGAPEVVERGEAGGRRFARGVTRGPDGRAAFETWMVEGAGHAWSGGDAAGSYTDAGGPDASAEMARFFLE